MEAVLTLILITGGVLGVLHLFNTNINAANKMELTLKATYLAQERLEQIVQDKEYKGYNFIVSANYPASENLTAQGFNGYIRTVNILEVNPTNLTNQQNGSGYKRVTVAVQVPGNDTVTLTTLLTYWGEQ